MNWKIICQSGVLLPILWGMCLPALAQEDLSVEPQDSVQIKQSKESGGQPIKSLVDSIFQNSRNRMGFSLGVNSMYSSNIRGGSYARQDDIVTTFAPSIFINFGKRRSKLHLSYGGGYRKYSDLQELDNMEHSGEITYSYQATRHISINISDSILSSTNDLLSSFNYSNQSSSSSASYDPLLSRRRVIQNKAGGTIDFTINRSSHLGISFNHQIYRYSGIQAENNIDNDGAQLGMNFERQITKWLSLTSSFSTHISFSPMTSSASQYNGSDSYRDAKIYRFDAGGMHFKLGRNWSVQASGGAEILDSRTQAKRRIEGMARGSLSRTSRTNSLSFSYDRSFTSIPSMDRMLQSNNFSVSLTQKLLRWVQLQISASHMRGNDVSYSGKLHGYNASSSLEFAILPNVIATLRYSYQNQKNMGMTAYYGNLNINRSIAFGGLQYVWPSSNR